MLASLLLHPCALGLQRKRVVITEPVGVFRAVLRGAVDRHARGKVPLSRRSIDFVESAWRDPRADQSRLRAETHAASKSVRGSANLARDRG